MRNKFIVKFIIKFMIPGALIMVIAPRLADAAPPLECHYVHPVFEDFKDIATKTPKLKAFSSAAERNDVRLIAFQKNFKANDGNFCRDKYKNYGGPEAFCMGLIQCVGAKASVYACAVNPAGNCPTATECFKDTSLSLAKIKTNDPDLTSLEKEKGASVIGKSGAPASDGMFLAWKTNEAKIIQQTKAIQFPIFPEVDFRITPLPFTNHNNSKTPEDIHFSDLGPLILKNPEHYKSEKEKKRHLVSEDWCISVSAPNALGIPIPLAIQNPDDASTADGNAAAGDAGQ